MKAAELIASLVEDLQERKLDELRANVSLSRPDVLNLDKLDLDHIAIAVRSLAEVLDPYQSLGSNIRLETLSSEGVRVAMIKRGHRQFELLEGLGDQSSVARFVARRGETIHHLAFRASGLQTLHEKLKLEGIRLASPSVGVGFGGHCCFFLHPAETNGVLVELVEEREDKV